MTGNSGIEQARQDAWKLAHDVGKYVSRTARNLTSGKISDGIADLLFEDLFEIDGKISALELFEQLALPLENHDQDGKLALCHRLLKEIDGNRSSIRNRDESMIRKAASNAIEVDSLLKSLASKIGGENR